MLEVHMKVENVPTFPCWGRKQQDSGSTGEGGQKESCENHAKTFGGMYGIGPSAMGSVPWLCHVELKSFGRSQWKSQGICRWGCE